MQVKSLLSMQNVSAIAVSNFLNYRELANLDFIDDTGRYEHRDIDYGEQLKELWIATQCRRCLYTSNHALGITFDETDCALVAKYTRKDQLDWKMEKARKTIAQYRSNSAKYDCIVPSSGANDSFFILDAVVNKLGLKPLVVSYNKLLTPKWYRESCKAKNSFQCRLPTKNPRSAGD